MWRSIHRCCSSSALNLLEAYQISDVHGLVPWHTCLQEQAYVEYRSIAEHPDRDKKWPKVVEKAFFRCMSASIENVAIPTRPATGFEETRFQGSFPTPSPYTKLVDVLIEGKNSILSVDVARPRDTF